MKKNALITWIALLFIIVFASAPTNASASDTVNLPVAKNVPTDKVWTVKFSQPVSTDMILKQYVQVVDEKNIAQDVQLSIRKDKHIVIHPPIGGYAPNETYKILIKKETKSASNNALKAEVTKVFETSSEKAAEAFQVRQDAANTLEYVENFKDSSEFTFLTTDYASGKVLVATNSSVVKGDFMAMPPTVEYPTGFVGKVTSSKQVANGYEISFTNPPAEEYVADMDISVEAPILAEHVTINEALFSTAKERSTLSKNPVEKLDNGFIIHLVNFEEEFDFDKSKTKHDGTEYKMEGSGTLTFDLDYIFENPTAFFDKKFGFNNDSFHFSADQSVVIDAKVEGHLEGSVTYKLADIGVPKLSLEVGSADVGLFATIFLTLEVKADGTISYYFTETYHTKVGYHQDDGIISDIYRKHSKTDDREEGLKLEATFMASAHLPAALQFRLFDDVLASVDFKPEITLTMDGKMGLKSMLNDQLPMACLHLKVEAANTSKLMIAFKKDKPFEDTLYEERGTLIEKDNCSIDQFKFEKETYTMKRDEESMQLDLTFNVGKKPMQPNLPVKEIKFTSSKANIVVNDKGIVSLTENARPGERAKIKAEMKIGEQTYRAETWVEVGAGAIVETTFVAESDYTMHRVLDAMNKQYGPESYEIVDYGWDTQVAYNMKLPLGQYIIEMKDPKGKIVKYAYDVYESDLEWDDQEYSSWQGYYVEDKLEFTMAMYEQHYGPLDGVKIVGARSNDKDELIEDFSGNPLDYVMDSRLNGKVIEIKPFAEGLTHLTITFEYDSERWDSNHIVDLTKHLNGYLLWLY